MKRDHATPFKKYRESLKEKAAALKLYLKGRVIKGTESYYTADANEMFLPIPKTFSREYKKKRKRRNKIAYRSRRINRLRCA